MLPLDGAAAGIGAHIVSSARARGTPLDDRPFLAAEVAVENP